MRWPCLLALLLAGCAAAGRERAVTTSPIFSKGLGVLPPQGPPRAGCALYLYSAGRGRLLLLAADSSTGTARIMLDGVVTLLPFIAFDGIPQSGFSRHISYGTERAQVALDLDLAGRTDMRGGAAIESGSLRLDRAGADSLALPVRGLIACRAP